LSSQVRHCPRFSSAFAESSWLLLLVIERVSGTIPYFKKKKP